MTREGFVPWPKEAADRYREAGYWRGRPLGSYLHEWAATYGDAVAVVDGDTRLTYRQLADRADGLACRLLDSGLDPGDAMLVQLPNGWEFVTLTLACLRAGIAPVMALPAHRGHELRYLAAHAEVTSIAVPDRLGDFDHQALGREVAEATPSVRLLLVAGGAVGTDATDLRALAEPADDPAAARDRLDQVAPDSGDIAVFLLSGGTTGTAEAHHPHPRRLRVQRAAQRRGLRLRLRHRLPGGAARRTQLPPGLPRHPRHPHERWPRGPGPHPGPRQGACA